MAQAAAERARSLLEVNSNRKGGTAELKEGMQELLSLCEGLPKQEELTRTIKVMGKKMVGKTPSSWRKYLVVFLDTIGEPASAEERKRFSIGEERFREAAADVAAEEAPTPQIMDAPVAEEEVAAPAEEMQLAVSAGSSTAPRPPRPRWRFLKRPENCSSGAPAATPAKAADISTNALADLDDDQPLFALLKTASEPADAPATNTRQQTDATPLDLPALAEAPTKVETAKRRAKAAAPSKARAKAPASAVLGARPKAKTKAKAKAKAEVKDEAARRAVFLGRIRELARQNPLGLTSKAVKTQWRHRWPQEPLEIFIGRKSLRRALKGARGLVLTEEKEIFACGLLPTGHSLRDGFRRDAAQRLAWQRGRAESVLVQECFLQTGWHQWHVELKDASSLFVCTLECLARSCQISVGDKLHVGLWGLCVEGQGQHFEVEQKDVRLMLRHDGCEAWLHEGQDRWWEAQLAGERVRLRLSGGAHTIEWQFGDMPAAVAQRCVRCCHMGYGTSPKLAVLAAMHQALADPRCPRRKAAAIVGPSPPVEASGASPRTPESVRLVPKSWVAKALSQDAPCQALPMAPRPLQRAPQAPPPPPPGGAKSSQMLPPPPAPIVAPPPPPPAVSLLRPKAAPFIPKCWRGSAQLSRRLRERHQRSRSRSREAEQSPAERTSASEEWRSLTLPLSLLRFTHDSIAPGFRDGRSFDELITGLLQGRFKPQEAFLKLEVVQDSGQKTYDCINNRRLYCLKEYVRRAALREEDVQVRCHVFHHPVVDKLRRSLTSNNGGHSVVVRRRMGYH